MRRPNRTSLIASGAATILAFAVLPCSHLLGEGARRDWTQTFDGPAHETDYAHSVAVDSSGNVFVTGMVTRSSTGTDIRTAKYSGADGRLLWEKIYSATLTSTFGDFGFVLRLDPAGNPIVLGNGAGVYLAKYAGATGEIIWEKTLPRTDQGGPEQPRALAVDAQGNIAVTAKGYGEIAFDRFSGQPYFVYDFYTAKLAGVDGQVLWSQRHAGPGRLDDIPYAIAIDGSGNVVVSGESSGANENGNWYVVKYAAGDGRVLWEQRYSTDANSFDRSFAVAIDQAGNVVATGKAKFDLYTAKYAASDGRLLWQQRLTGPSSREGRALAIDSAGNAIVVGDSYVSGRAVVYTVKYDATDGRIRWERMHDGGGHAAGYAVQRDAAQDVFVLGTEAPDVEAPNKFYLAKYRGADGSIVWERNYHATFNGDDFPGAGSPLALAGNGAVVFAGYFKKSFSDFDWTVVKYTPADDLLNISTRMRVETGDNVLIAGFIVTGAQPKRVLIRGLGPSLPVAGALADPVLELDGGAVTNDSWRSARRRAKSLPPPFRLPAIWKRPSWPRSRRAGTPRFCAGRVTGPEWAWWKFMISSRTLRRSWPISPRAASCRRATTS